MQNIIQINFLTIKKPNNFFHFYKGYIFWFFSCTWFCSRILCIWWGLLLWSHFLCGILKYRSTQTITCQSHWECQSCLHTNHISMDIVLEYLHKCRSLAAVWEAEYLFVHPLPKHTETHLTQQNSNV